MRWRHKPQPGWGTQFVDRDFSGAAFQDLHWMPWLEGLFLGCTFDGADLWDVKVGRARFERCSFLDTRTTRWVAEHADFLDCRFGGDRMHDVAFFGASAGREFRGNDFSGAALHGASFNFGVDFDEQVMPQGPEFVRLDRIQERLARALRVVGSWPDRERVDARALLTSLVLPDDPQPELFMRRDGGYSMLGEDLTERVLALLEQPL